MVLKLLSHRKSSLLLSSSPSLTDTHTHTQTADDTTQESDGCRKEDVCLELCFSFSFRHERSKNKTKPVDETVKCF